MSRYATIKALALAVLGGLVGADSSPGKHRASQHARTPRFKWNYSEFRKPGRSDDESVRRRTAAHMRRNAKAAARLRWRAAGGASTLAERTAAGVPGV
jgi:hypothetical protein